MKRLAWSTGLMAVLCAPVWAADTLYHCKAYNGGVFWSKQHCQEREALVDRIVSVPSGLKWAEQVRLAEQGAKTSSRASTQSERLAQADEKVLRQQVRALQRHERHCAEWQQQLDHQASLARLGGSARKLERIARRQQTLQEQRQQAGC